MLTTFSVAISSSSAFDLLLFAVAGFSPIHNYLCVVCGNAFLLIVLSKFGLKLCISLVSSRSHPPRVQHNFPCHRTPFTYRTSQIDQLLHTDCMRILGSDKCQCCKWLLVSHSIYYMWQLQSDCPGFETCVKHLMACELFSSVIRLCNDGFWQWTKHTREPFGLLNVFDFLIVCHCLWTGFICTLALDQRRLMNLLTASKQQQIKSSPFWLDHLIAIHRAARENVSKSLQMPLKCGHFCDNAWEEDQLVIEAAPETFHANEIRAQSPLSNDELALHIRWFHLYLSMSLGV